MAQPDPLVIEERFHGPPGAASGGYVGGLLAERIGPRVEVNLRRPTPVGAALRLCPWPDDIWALEDPAADGARNSVLAVARPGRAHVEPPLRPGLAEAEAVHTARLLAEHPFRSCFVCGPERAPGDGLRLLAGPVAPGVVAAPWRPGRELGEGGLVAPRFIWAALDCPGAHATVDGALALAHMSGCLEAPVRTGEAYVVMGWQIAREGHKHFVGTALLDAAGRVCARSRQIWLELDTVH